MISKALLGLKVLIVEDDKSDEDLLLRELKQSGLELTSLTVQTRHDFENGLSEFAPDLILSDYSLPNFDAVTAFNIKQQNHQDIPFILVSGFIGEENAIELIKNGVTDYVSKERLYTLSTKIKRALDEAGVRREKKIADETLVRQSAELKTLNQQLEQRVLKRTKALADSENRFRNMMETIPQIAWTNTEAGDVVYYNQSWYNYTGLSEEQTKRSGFKAVIHPDDLAKCATQYHQIISSRAGGEFQARAQHNDGSYRWHLIRLMPINEAQGLMQLWIGTATDIQELRLLQQQKDDFISIASHELKTPITSLKACLQLLDRAKDNPSSKAFPALIAQANKSMEKVNILIDDLLNAGMANEGQLHINPEKFVLAEMIEDCSHNARTEGKYQIIVEGELNTEIYADPHRIEQVVTNFITNAIKYATGSFEIKILIEKHDGYVKVSVIDSGPGIDPDKLRFLFDRYYRVNGKESHYNGLGLGLYICAEIIKKHHGQIGVDSEIGKGTAFWFTLPS